MSATKATTKKVDKRTKSSLFGYNRKHPRNIPIPITYLCLLYYFEYDKWNKSLIDPAIKLKDDNVTIQHIGGPNGKHASSNAYLANQWSSGQCQWKFKVINLVKKVGMWFPFMVFSR